MNVFDIVGPVMIGPSSSHTAGAVRIGRVARALLGCEPVSAQILLHGSFAKTYKGHGTDKALIAGIMGMATDDERIRFSPRLAEEAGLTFQFRNGVSDIVFRLFAYLAVMFQAVPVPVQSGLLVLFGTLSVVIEIRKTPTAFGVGHCPFAIPVKRLFIIFLHYTVAEIVRQPQFALSVEIVVFGSLFNKIGYLRRIIHFVYLPYKFTHLGF